MAKITRLTESDLMRIVKRIVREQSTSTTAPNTSTINPNKISLCGEALSDIRQSFAREPQINIQVFPKEPTYLVVTPPKGLYGGQPCLAKREEILRLS